jgi:serine/threonine-protein kinase RsbW
MPVVPSDAGCCDVSVDMTAARDGGTGTSRPKGVAPTMPAQATGSGPPAESTGTGPALDGTVAVRPGSGEDLVLLTLPASSIYLSVLRTATAGLAARLQFTLDEIEDLRIAVDEACAMLLAGEELPEAELYCRFTLSRDAIAVTVTLPGVRREQPPRNTFAWQVLTALTGEVEANVTNGQLTLALVKRRGHTP